METNPSPRRDAKRSPNGARKRKTNGIGKRKQTGSERKTSSKGSYDVFKEFEGRRYTGMKIGRGHKWRYDEGDWIERKLTPEKWEIQFTTVKRRRGHAPEGSGVPVGTEYHWYVLADQTAKKLDANSYATDMVGHKWKLAHKRADKEAWSASENAQRAHLVKILKQMIAELEKGIDRPTAPAKAKAAEKPKAGAKKRTGNGRHLAAA